MKDRWEGWKRGICKGNQIHVPRCIVPLKERGIKHVTHCFADASKGAYCATVYLVCKLHYTAHSNLVAAKTRLPPVKKKMTMPRLALTAARIAVRLATSVKEALSSYIIEEFHMWSDSSTVLHWLEGKGRYKQFVEHRVRKICSLMPDVLWKYCPADENTADLGTRGKTKRQLQESNFWWKVPSWLCTARWPHQQYIDQMHYEGQEEEIQPVLQVQRKVKSSTGMSAIIKLEKFSSRYRLLRVTA